MQAQTIYPRDQPASVRTNANEERSAIEKRFPRIANQLVENWGSGEIDHIIDSFLLDDRGDRMGFPIDVLDELMFLAGVRWNLSHLCGTLIDTTSADAFSFSGNRTELCGSNSRTWVLL